MEWHNIENYNFKIELLIMKRKENSDEIRARLYLQTLQYDTLEYEPLGNVTPDFLIDSKIAIEVRRLNRNYVKDERLIGMDSTQISNIDHKKEYDSSWMIQQLHKNIQLTIDEKNKKIDKNFKIYDEWWLVLVNYVTDSISSEEFEKLNAMKIHKSKFSKIIILSSNGDFRVFKF